MTENKAVIWARVSTPGQKDPSLDSQVERAKAKLANEDYSIYHIYQVVWTSTNLRPCPDFQNMQDLINSGKIQAICMLDRDRIEDSGRQRINFFAECTANNVLPIMCQGPPFQEGDEGELIEYVLSLGKRKANQRA